MTELQTKRVVAVSIFGLLFLLYLSQVPLFPVGYADSDMILAVGHFLGLAHPPGYPLNSLLLHVFTRLIPFGTVAFRGHVLSVLLHSSLFGLLTLLLLEMFLSYKTAQLKATGWFVYAAVCLSVLSIALSPIFLINSTVTEKYPLNNLLGIAWLWLLWFFNNGDSSSRNLSLILGACFGVLLFQHQALWLLAALGAWLIWQNRSQFYPKWFGVGLSIISTLLLSLLLYANSRDVPVSWQFETSFSGVVGQLFRKELSGSLISGADQRMFFLPRIVTQFFNQLPHFILWHVEQVGWLGLGIALLGIGWLLKYGSRDNWLRFLLLLILLTTVLVPLYIPWPQDFGTQSHVERHYLLGLWVMAIPFSFGLLWFKQIMDGLVKGFLIPLGMLLVMFGLVYWQVSRISDNSLKEFDDPYRHYQTVLHALPDNSRLGCLSDQSCFSLFYLQTVEGAREDVVVVPSAYRFVEKRLDSALDSGFDYQQNPFVWLEHMTRRLGDRETYIVDIQPRIQELLGVDHGMFVLVPRHSFFQLHKSGELDQLDHLKWDYDESLVEGEARILKQWRARGFQTHMTAAREWARLGEFEQAQDHLQKTRTYLDRLPAPYTASYAVNQQIVAEQNTVDWQSGINEVEALQLINRYAGTGDLEEALQVSIAASFLYPDSFVLRQQLISLLDQSGNKIQARTERERLQWQLEIK